MLYDFLSQNTELVYFLYGLSFFTMGVVVGAKNPSYSAFTLGRNLWSLSAFGLSHGIAEWVREVIPPYISPWVQGNDLRIVYILVIALSFTFLFHFGLSLLLDSKNSTSLVWIFPWVLFALWLGIFLIGGKYYHVLGESRWTILASIWARYLLALPGSILTAWSLYIQRKELEALSLRGVVFDLKVLGFVFLAYGVLAGVLVSRSTFFPASVINKIMFFNITHIPVELLRAACAIMILFFSIKILKIFALEYKVMIEEMERKRTSYYEREQIKARLHDGIIQSVCAVGLYLDATARSLEDGSPAKLSIKDSIQKLNHVIAEVREVVGNLKLEFFGWDDLVSNLRIITEEMTKTQQINITFTIEGDQEYDNFLSSFQSEQMFWICKEALHNVLKHAEATRVSILLSFKPTGFYLKVSDDGKGLNLVNKSPNFGEGMGLKIMQNRAKSIGGQMTIKGKTGQGTTLKIIVKQSVGSIKGVV